MGSEAVMRKPLQYPIPRRDESVVDNYHGVAISDPYCWLEDPDSEEVKEFVEKQMKATESVLRNCDSRDKLRERLTKSYDYPRYGCPFRKGNKYFYFHNPGLHPHPILYMQESLDDEGEVLLDPNELSEDGTVALRVFEVSHDAKYLAYGLSVSGSDWVTIQVMSVDKKTIEPDKLSWVKFTSISWTHDTKGFFYCRFPAPREVQKMDAGTEVNVNYKHQLFYHLLGTKQSEDILCWNDFENPTDILKTRLAEDGKYLLMNICKGAARVNKFYYCDLSALQNGLEGHRGKEILPFVKVIDDFDANYEAIANNETIFTFLTNKDAPRYKLVRVDLKNLSIWSEVVHESRKDVIESVLPINGNQMIVSYLSDCKHVLQIRDLEGGDLLHSLPIDIGSVDYISARRLDNVFFVKLSSFINPGVVYQYDLRTIVPQMRVLREIVVPGLDLAEYHANQRPDLFGCALAHAGVMDMLRYHKFTIGHAWLPEFGCSNKEDDFRYLIKYSPLHNVKRPWEDSSIKATQYPSTMLLTADHDDRVVPLHTLKLLATMQHELCTSVKNSPQSNPIIGRISSKCGHGCGSSTQKRIDKWADCYSFMAHPLGASWTD